MTKASFVFNKENYSYLCIGKWSILERSTLIKKIKATTLPSSQKLTIDGGKLTYFDSAAALTLLLFIAQLQNKKNKVTLTGFSPQHQDLINTLEENSEALAYVPPKHKPHGWIFKLGQETIHKLDQAVGLITLVGDFTEKIGRAFLKWRRFQFRSIVANIDVSGLQALPIVGLLSFLIGIVLAYQMGLQLESYGANNFIAYLSGMAIFREFAPLITAIIIAGRTSSAYTAQIGSMKINEEIDALHTMGLSPTELLIVPKVLGLLLVFPLLIFWADTFGLLGAMLMSKQTLDIGYADFLSRVQETVGLQQLKLGMYKAPAFAILIALVGCFQGLRVESNADSVGKQTTKSVVQALFLIIVTDAIYSIIYSWKGL